MKEKTKWINLSTKQFESKKYQNPEEPGFSTILKPKTGLWFSLPSNRGFVSEWGEFLNREKWGQESVLDEEGETNIITAELKESSYMVELEEWFKDIVEEIQGIDRNLSNEEKRAKLLERVRQVTGNHEINYLIFKLRERDFDSIIDIYVNNILNEKEQREYRIEKTERTFIEDEDVMKCVINRDYKSFKKCIQDKIQLLKTLENLQELEYEELKKYLDFDNDIRIKNTILSRTIETANEELIELFMENQDKEQGCSKFLELIDEETRRDILKHSIDVYKGKYSHLTVEDLNEYVNFISECNTWEEYKNRNELPEGGTMRIDHQLAISWVTDYFSGCMNSENINGYDMPSLAVFDTECIEVLSEEKRRIFESEKGKKNEEHSAKEISEDLYDIAKISDEKSALREITAVQRDSLLEENFYGEC